MNSKPINLDALKALPTTDALAVLGQAINSLATTIERGQIWEDKVAADRRMEETEDTLISVITAQLRGEALK